MVCTEFYPLVGGMQTHTLALSRHLQENGVRVLVLTRRNHGLPAFEHVQGVPVYRVFTCNASKLVASLSFTLSAMRFLIRHRLEYEIVHSHQLFSPTTVGLLAQAILSKPLIANPHGGGYCGDIYRVRQRRRLGTMRLSVIGRRADRFVAISSEIAGELEQVGVPRTKIRRVPNGVDTARFAPAEEAERHRLRQILRLPEGLIVSFVGRLVAQKGLDVLLAAWTRVAKHGVTLLILGDGPQRQRLERECRDRGLAEHIRFVGKVDNVVEFFQCSDICVLPSRSEGLPIALLEAMACCVPAVASAVGAVPEVIEDGINGILVPPEDEHELARQLSRLVENGPRRRQLGACARLSVVSTYAMAAVCKRYISLYSELART
jgi:glycosyltransferase involved in cell wall biosynthesis